jgi:hypothetical protein
MKYLNTKYANHLCARSEPMKRSRTWRARTLVSKVYPNHFAQMHIRFPYAHSKPALVHLSTSNPTSIHTNIKCEASQWLRAYECEHAQAIYCGCGTRQRSAIFPRAAASLGSDGQFRDRPRPRHPTGRITGQSGRVESVRVAFICPGHLEPLDSCCRIGGAPTPISHATAVLEQEYTFAAITEDQLLKASLPSVASRAYADDSPGRRHHGERDCQPPHQHHRILQL